MLQYNLNDSGDTFRNIPEFWKAELGLKVFFFS